MRLRWLAVPFVAFLAACGTRPCPTLAPQLDYCLQPPGVAPQLVSLQQVVVRKEGRSETLLVQVENDGRRLAVVGLSPLGQTLVAATWDGTDVQAQPVLPSLAPAPAAMLALVQFGLMSPAYLSPGFAPDLLIVADDSAAGARIEVRESGGRTLLAIERAGRVAPFDRVRIALPTAGIELDSRALNEEPKPPAAR